MECVPEDSKFRLGVTDESLGVEPELLDVSAVSDEVLGPPGVVILFLESRNVCLLDHALFSCAT
jgi:hypothetical protein